MMTKSLSASVAHGTVTIYILMTSFFLASLHALEVHRGTIGLPVTLPCSIELNTVAMWFSPSEVLLTTDTTRQTWDQRFSVQSMYQRERNLRISPVQMSDGGTYRCRQAGSLAVLAEIRLEINVPPMLESSADQTIELGRDVTMKCTLLSGTPKPIIRWTFRGNGNEYGLSNVGETLTLTNVSRDQAGEYSCLADNEVPPAARKTIRLDVLFSPTLMLPYRELRQPSASNALLTCIVDSNPPGTVYWQRDYDETKPVEQPLHPLSGAGADDAPSAMQTPDALSKFRVQTWTISRDGYTRLVGAFIDDLDSNYFSSYTCFASNKYGTAKAQMSIVAFNQSDINLPSYAPSTEQLSISIVIILASLLGFVTIIAVIFIIKLVRIQRGVVTAYDMSRQPRIYKNNRP